jgi:hypothetical protein
LLALATAPCAVFADEPSPAPKPAASAPAPRGPLRHLVFGLTVDVQTQTDMRTRSVDAAMGGNTEHYAASGSSRGTITCDIVGVAAGNLLVDVTEAAAERSSATKRVAVQSDGGLVYLPNQGTLNEEESELVSLLAPGLMGGDRAIGDSWTFRLTSPNYTATKTFRLADIKSESQISLSFEETFARTGADALTGTLTGTIAYDPSGLVPLSAKLDKTTRQEDANGYKTRKLGMDYALQEDSRAKH